MRQTLLFAVLGASMAALGCQRGENATPTPAVRPEPATPPAAPPSAPAANAAPGDELQPSGPRAELRETTFLLTAAVTPGAAGAPASLAIELHGAGGYHVNELYPIAVDLDLRNATTPKTNLRRADAAEYAQSGARFAVPITSTGAGTTVRGRVRFAVCSAENCVPETRNFAVAL
ncbi:MAG: hypothetical protein JNK72_02280 [Myxococcales bacterium]|nr:hypothetical protein [Myxococcales bacterium]